MGRTHQSTDRRVFGMAGLARPRLFAGFSECYAENNACGRLGISSPGVAMVHWSGWRISLAQTLGIPWEANGHTDTLRTAQWVLAERGIVYLG